MPRRYRIYLLSAKSILSYAKEEGGAVTIALNRDATRRCQLPGRQEQEENALFFQIQCALHGDWFTPTEESGVVEDLSAVLSQGTGYLEQGHQFTLFPCKSQRTECRVH